MQHRRNTDRGAAMSVKDFDAELLQAIQNLVDEGELDEKSDAYGIAMKVVHEGHASLSPKQLYVYETRVEALLVKSAPKPDYDPEPPT